MFRHTILLLATILVVCGPAQAQLTQQGRFAILQSVFATEGAARVGMPLGKAGVEITDKGVVNTEKLRKELAENGQAIAPGRVVLITGIEFDDKSIEIELDNGGTKKKSFLSNIQLSAGGVNSGSQPRNEPAAKGSKITLKFSEKIPVNLTPELLKGLLNPLLDFSRQSVARAGIEALPPEFQDAIKEKKAMIGMNGATVRLALGAPNKTGRDRAGEVEQETWTYEGRGRRTTFVTFEGDVVVSVREY